MRFLRRAVPQASARRSLADARRLQPRPAPLARPQMAPIFDKLSEALFMRCLMGAPFLRANLSRFCVCSARQLAVVLRTELCASCRAFPLPNVIEYITLTVVVAPRLAPVLNHCTVYDVLRRDTAIHLTFCIFLLWTRIYRVDRLENHNFHVDKL
eukprot:IDg16781t1